MAEYKLIPLSEIFVPERLRAVEEDHAIAIAQSIVEHGLINPITVRSTPAAKGGKYTLVAGAHRRRSYELNDEDEIPAIVVEADKDEAQLVEIVENLFRNDLSVMDRAIFVQSYRDVWEAKYGKIDRSHNLKQSKGQVGPSTGSRANLAQMLADEAESGGFSAHVAERMGVSVRAVKRLNQIAQNLTPKLREKLRGTDAADNQSLLLNLAKRGPTEQGKIAAAMASTPDVKQVIAALAPTKVEPSKADKQEMVKIELLAAWKKADAVTRSLFVMDRLIEAGASVELARQVKVLFEARP